MKALISPNEKIYASDGTVLGDRIAQVCEESFDVALPLFWVDCPDDCMSSTHYYSDGQFYLIPPPEPVENSGLGGLLE